MSSRQKSTKIDSCCSSFETLSSRSSKVVVMTKALTIPLESYFYKLANEKGEIFTNAWNIEQLRRFYP